MRVPVLALAFIRSPVAGESAAVTVSVFRHIHKCRISDMVHNHIKDNADSLGVGEINELAHFINGTYALVHFSKVKCIVAMVAIVGKVTVLTAYPAVHLFPRSCNPNCICTQISEIAFFQFLGQTFNISAVESTHIRAPGICLRSGISAVIAGVPVVETVCHDEVNVCIIPTEWACFLLLLSAITDFHESRSTVR
ncbi:hypothetical protein D3C81_862940 [compost metagenome]